MSRHIISLILIAIFGLLSFSACKKNDMGIDSPSIQPQIFATPNLSYDEKYFPKKVSAIPDGFIPLDSAIAASENALSYTFFETHIFFSGIDPDLGGASIKAINVNDENFIVDYQGTYCIDENTFDEMLRIAALRAEELEQTYALGDIVEMHGDGEKVYTVQILSVEIDTTKSVHPQAMTMYEIKFSASSNLPKKVHCIIKSTIELNTGKKHDGFWLYYAGQETKSVYSETRKDEKIKAIILKNPDYPAIEYKILVDE